ncbi:hypothetical protein ACCS86_37685, partial [Rhizobium ruizarguesonis]
VMMGFPITCLVHFMLYARLAHIPLRECLNESLKRLTFNRIHAMRFKPIVYAFRCPKTAAHFWATSITLAAARGV